MRATGNGPLGALLMLAPLVAIPILAVVGIPQFAGGNLIDLNGSKASAISRDNREPAESRLGDAARHDADDLFAPLGESSNIDGFEDPLSSPKRGQGSGRISRPDDDFASDRVASRSKRTPGRGRPPVDEMLDADAEPFDVGDELDTDQSVSGTSGRRRLDGNSNSADLDEPFDASEPDQFMKGSGKQARPIGKQFADISRDLSAEPDANDAGAIESIDEASLFESAPAVNSTRPAPQKPKPPTATTRPRDPRDAPVFEPEESAAADNENTGEPAVRPAPKTPTTKPRSNSPKSPVVREEQGESEAAPAAVQPPTASDELTWQIATKRLRALGVGKSKQYFTYLEDKDVFLFTCQAISGQDPAKTQRFQAEADEPLLAVRQVLEQLEAWQTPLTKRRAQVAN